MEPSIIERVTSISELASIKTVGGVGLRLGTLIKRTSKGSMMKKCTKCGVEKDESEFGLDARKDDRLRSSCRACNNSQARSRYASNPTDSLSRNKVWRNNNMGKVKTKNRVYYAEHIDKFRERNRVVHTSEEAKALRMIYTSRGRAKSRGLPHTLGVQDILPIPTTCPVLGLPMSLSGGRREPYIASLDRVIPELGYVPGNTEVISNRANKLKSDATIEELELVLAYMKRHEAARREATNNLTTSAPVGSIDSGAHLTERTSDE